MIGMREIIFVNFGKLLIIIAKKNNVVRKCRVRICRPQKSGPHMSSAIVVRKSPVRMCRPHMSGPHVRIRKCRNTKKITQKTRKAKREKRISSIPGMHATLLPLLSFLVTYACIIFHLV